MCELSIFTDILLPILHVHVHEPLQTVTLHSEKLTILGMHSHVQIAHECAQFPKSRLCK